MLSLNELYAKYPSNIVDCYFNDGIMLNWGDEYFDIAWQYSRIGMVILSLFKHDILISDIDVLEKDDFALEHSKNSHSYEGSNWNSKNILSTIQSHFNSELTKQDFLIFDAISFLQKFYFNNKAGISKYIFKLSF